MAIAHVCLGCGWDLARVRPQREPHYGLDLIRCPRCRAAVVRRKHPIWTRWRQFRRLDFAITVLGARVFITALLTFLNVMAAMLCVVLLSELRVDREWPDGAGVYLIMIFGMLAPLTGTWLTAAFEHIPRWRMWFGWLLWIALILVVLSLHGPFEDQFDRRPSPQEYDGPIWQWMLEGIRNIAVPGAAATALMLIAAIPGLLVGRGLLRLTANVRRTRWRLGRRRRRLASAAV